MLTFFDLSDRHCRLDLGQKFFLLTFNFKFIYQLFIYCFKIVNRIEKKQKSSAVSRGVYFVV